MNVASLELCKELYELSGWGDTYFTTEERFDDGELIATDMIVNPGYEDNGRLFGKVMRNQTPRYDLGYLLRKLPSFIDTAKNSYRLEIVVRQLNDDKEAQMGYCMLRQVSKGFEKLYWSPLKNTLGKPQALIVFGSLEDAAAKLCIELIKQGVLKP